MAVAVVGQARARWLSSRRSRSACRCRKPAALRAAARRRCWVSRSGRDDINAKGGLLGRKVELVVYDDKSSASETPAIYAKLVDVDKVDRCSRLRHVPTARSCRSSSSAGCC